MDPFPRSVDRVNGYMLDLAMQRIKMSASAREFILNLFSRRTNRVITTFGLSEPYDVLIGIDQGEIISPLLWCIYYDPLLCEIERHQLGYELSHSYKPNLYNDPITLRHNVSSLAYMDDTQWLSGNQHNLERI